MAISRSAICLILVCCMGAAAQTHAIDPASAKKSRSSASAHPSPDTRSIHISIYERFRVDSWQWFAAPPASATYAYEQSLLRISAAQRFRRWDWQLELAQPAILGLPGDAVSPVPAQGQLGLGGTYYASSGDNTTPAAAFLKQGFIRLHFGDSGAVRVGRFEFLGGTETHPANRTVAWLQANRVQQRLVGNFGFTNAQRSFDGADVHFDCGSWNLTGMIARADQGVFNMNGNPELNVDLQYLSLTRSAAHGRLLARAFGIGYHDGRTGLTKTDNRPLAVRQADHKNIRLGTYGGNLIAVQPVGIGTFEFLFWGALQNGNWGRLNQRAGAADFEGGYRLTGIAGAPWLRGGWWRATGDDHPDDRTNNTFFQILPTPRVYARLPFYNLMNSTDGFVQAIDRPVKSLELRSDLHWLQLTSSNDLWYLGGGAYDNKVFGFTGRPANGHRSFASVADISSDWQATRELSLNLYYGRGLGKRVISSIYPEGHNIQFGYVEMVYRWGGKVP